MRRSPPLTAVEGFETTFFVVALAMMSEALLGPAFGGFDGRPSPGWLQTMWLPVYAVLSGLLVLRARRLPSVWLGGLLTLPLVALAFMSVGWSLAPDVTLRRSVALLFTSLLGLQIAARYGWRGMIELFATVFMILAVGSVVAALLFPGFGVHSEMHTGAWRGLWEEKNQLGAYMSKGALACLSAAIVVPRRRRLWSVGALLCSLLVVLSTSTTSLLALLLVLGGALALACLRKDAPVRVVAISGLLITSVLVAAIVALAPDVPLEALGKDTTLTGRTDIWTSLLRYTEARRMEGFGYAAFWADGFGPAWYVRNEIGWTATTAHNGWLDLLIQLGWTGVVLFTVHFAVTAAAASRRLFSGPEGFWALLSIGLLLLASFSESTFMQQNNLNWVLYIATAAKLFERHRPTVISAAPQPSFHNVSNHRNSFAAPDLVGSHSRAVLRRPRPPVSASSGPT